MPQDAQAPKEKKPGSPQLSSSRRHESQWFTTPQPIKRLFNTFPLRIYSPNELPQRAAPDQTCHNLYIFTTDEAARRGSPSFNPSCLKWQVYLKFKAINFCTVASNNHASPTGALPFLVPSGLNVSASENRLPIPSTKIQQWVHTITSDGDTKPKRSTATNTTSLSHPKADDGDQPKKQNTLNQESSANSPREEHPDMRHKAYMSLLDNRIRNAWLYFLYLEPSNFASVANPLYITPCSSNFLVRAILAHNLRAAAKSELVKQSPVVDVESLYVECERAFSALSEILGEDRYFFAAERPGLFDASVFAYTNVLLDGEMAWRERRMIEGLERCENLVRHRGRILQDFF